MACLYTHEPEFEECFPVVGAISGAAGNIAALEAIKILSGEHTPAYGKMFVLDLRANYVQSIDLVRDTACRVCGSISRTDAESLG